MLTCVLSCCSMSRLGGSNGTSNVQASSLGSNTSMESAKTAAASQRDPQQLPDDSEQAREAAALVEWIHEQVCLILCYSPQQCAISITIAVGPASHPVRKSVLRGLAVHLQGFPKGRIC